MMDVAVLCGGKGTRAYPYSEHFPKVMMPIGGTPILVHLMRIYADQGCRRFVLAVGHRKEIVYDYFHDRFSDWEVEIVDTGADSDTGERLRRCLPYLSDTFFATYGDGLGDVSLHKLADFHRRSGGLATLTSVPLRSQYGTVHFDHTNRVEHFQEKPIIRNSWINAGYFIFKRSVFEMLDGQNLEADVLPALAAQGQLYSYQHHGFWKSMDTSKDQHEMESFLVRGSPPWSRQAERTASAAD
jgi:glucose-1-phosphate cytidylyltransferase